MPNWVRNIVTVEGPPPLVDEFKKSVATEQSALSFQKVIPQPDDLPDWYGWNITNWGTKWDAHVVEVDATTPGKAVYTFDTAWAPPFPVITTLAETHTGLKFELRYEEEQGWGGSQYFDDGKLIDEDTYEAPESHAEFVARHGGCYCEGDNTEQWFPDCYAYRAAEAELPDDVKEIAQRLASEWEGTFDELLEAAAKL